MNARIMYRVIWILHIWIAVFWHEFSHGEDLSGMVLIEHGNVRCEVVAVEAEAKVAARELTEYLEKASGVAIPLTDGRSLCQGRPIFVGGRGAVAAATGLGLAVDKTAWEGLSQEGYLIRCSGGIMLLAGKTGLSACYAVDKFLQEYVGVRWFMPGELGEVAPIRETVKVGEIEEVGEPAFRWRWVGKGKWARRNGMNVAVDCEGEFKSLWFAHTFMRLLPPEKYLDRHPEYYALVDGKRGHRKRKSSKIQLCTSNPDVVKEVAERIVKIRETDPSLKLISLDPMDTHAFCECPTCRALDEVEASAQNAITRRMFLFYNAVSGFVRTRHPDLLLKSIAYHKYVAPPLDQTLKVNDNSLIQVCRFMCHNHAVSDPDCPYNRAYDKYLKGWREIAAHVALYEYYYKVSWLELPWPIVHTLRKDIPYFHKLGLFGLATQYAENFGSNGLAYYLAAKLLWDPGLDVDLLLEDFYTKFYDEAADPMRDYYETLERTAISSDVHLARQRPYEEVVRFFSPDLLARLDRCVSRAEKEAKDEKVRQRVALVRASLDYAKVCAEYLRALDQVQEQGALPWAGGRTVDRARDVGGPYLRKIREALEHGRKIKATGGQDNPYVKRLLDPAAVLRSWNKPEYGWPVPEMATHKQAWLRARGLRGGNAELPDALSIWVVGYDFDAGVVKSECSLWTIGSEGRKIIIGGLAPAMDPGNKQDRCYVFHNLETSTLISSRENVLLFITNPSGGWTHATLYAVYLMPGVARLTSNQAINRVVKDIDSVRERALGFVEFQESGLAIADGQTVALEIGLIP